MALPRVTAQEEAPALGLHMTNVTGLGASTLLRSLLPAIEERAADRFKTVVLYMPPAGTDLAAYEPLNGRSAKQLTRRYLPNAMSRLLECTLMGWRYRGNQSLIVLGDLPIAFVRGQVLFVHTAHVTRSSNAQSWHDRFKYAVSRMVFRLNQGYVRHVIVQTDVMAHRLLSTYPELTGRLSIVPQPPPDWLLEGMPRGGRTGRLKAGALRLIFPSADYPHKNHRVIYRSAPALAAHEVEEIIVTIDQPTSGIGSSETASCLRFVGRLRPAGILAHYASIDALLFPSLEESFGLPLIEAMYVGLPILCADLPYARTLCGDAAIYFSPHDPDSLRKGIAELRRRLEQGWWPEWSSQLAALPHSWHDVAERILSITQGHATSESKTSL